MDGDNKINCEICNTKRTCHKRQIFKSLPNILVIALKRFEFDYDSMIRIKLNSYFKFPFELNMKELSFEFSLTYEDVFILNNNKYIFAIWFESSENKNIWKLGKPFLKKYLLRL